MPFGKKKYRNLNVVHVFKDALKHNLHLYQKWCPHQAICPVLKSNAYGHGLTLVAKALDDENLPFFVVDSLYEAYELKKARIKTPILIIGASHPESLHTGIIGRVRRLPFHFSVYNKESAELFAKLGYPVHLKIETGFSRLGFSLEALTEQLPFFKKIGLNIEGVYTHFADADNPHNDAKTTEQVQRFETALTLIEKTGFSPKWIHCANSAGALKVKNPKFNMARLGISLYGIPVIEGFEGLKPAMELESTLIAINEVKKGETVGYGGTFTAPHPMRIGIIPVGYYEALPRSLSNAGCVEVNGTLCPIVGRVCMNLCMVDLSHAEAKLYDPVIVYSRHPEQKNSVLEQSKAAQLIPYELLVHISESVARRLE
ncbi:MAG: alanine racemase [Candidatus Gracilibacteria bacterium]|jgi:alanine racemase